VVERHSRLSIDFSSVAQGKHNDGLLGIAEVTDNPVIPDAVAPQFTFLPAQGFPRLAWIAELLKAMQEAGDADLDLGIQLAHLVFGCPLNLDAPSQGGAPVLGG
jgi:hypothetical protein